jgi:hypothetical protein
MLWWSKAKQNLSHYGQASNVSQQSYFAPVVSKSIELRQEAKAVAPWNISHIKEEIVQHQATSPAVLVGSQRQNHQEAKAEADSNSKRLVYHNDIGR